MNDLVRQVTAIDLEKVTALHITSATPQEVEQMNAAGWYRK